MARELTSPPYLWEFIFDRFDEKKSSMTMLQEAGRYTFPSTWRCEANVAKWGWRREPCIIAPSCSFEV